MKNLTIILTAMLVLSCGMLSACSTQGKKTPVDAVSTELTPNIEPIPTLDTKTPQETDFIKLKPTNKYDSSLSPVPTEVTVAFEDTLHNTPIPDIRKGEKVIRFSLDTNKDTSYWLLTSIPEQDVYLYGYNNPAQPYWGLVLDMGETQTLYPIPNWYMDNRGLVPSIAIVGDAVCIITYTGGGTSYSVNELYVVHSGRYDVFHLDNAIIVNQLNENSKFIFDSVTQQVQFWWLDKLVAEQTLDTIGTYSGEVFMPDSYSFGNHINYEIDRLPRGDSLILHFSPTFYRENASGEGIYNNLNWFSVPLNITHDGGTISISIQDTEIGQGSVDTPSPAEIITNNEDEKTEQHIAAQLPQIMEAYKLVLNGSADFTDATLQEEQRLNLSQLQQSGFVNNREKAVKITSFSVLDLDHDAVPEVVLASTVGSVNLSIVLSYHEGKVYGHTFQLRQFMDLKADGTFSFSSGAFDHGIGTIIYNGKECTVAPITYCQSLYDSTGARTVDCFVQNKAATGEEFELAIQEQHAKKGTAWYDYTTEKIDVVFTNQ